MSEMVERVAEAMNRSEVDWRDIDEASVTCLARAAIAAMRLPTQEMVKAGALATRKILDWDRSATATRVWQSMIDATLAGKKP